MDWAKTIAISLVVFGHILMPFSIFAVHQSILWPLRDVIPDGAWSAFVSTVFTILIISGFVWLARKYCPVFMGKMK